MPDEVALKKKRSLQKRSCLTSGHVMMASSQAGFMYIHGSMKQLAHIHKSVPGIWEFEFLICPFGTDIYICLESHQLCLSTLCVYGQGAVDSGSYPSSLFLAFVLGIYAGNKVPSLIRSALARGTA